MSGGKILHHPTTRSLSLRLRLMASPFSLSFESCNQAKGWFASDKKNRRQYQNPLDVHSDSSVKYKLAFVI